MKKHLTFITLFLFSILSFGQRITVDEILSIKEEKVPIYKPVILSGTQLYLKMDYGSSVILNSSEIKELIGAKIASIDIVYSDHPHGDQYKSLIRKRIENLKKLNPTLFADKWIQWKLIRQTSCSDKSSAQKLFHGIVITYRHEQTKEEVVKEISYLKDLFSKLSEGSTDAITVSELITIETKFLTDSISFGHGVFNAGISTIGVYHPKFSDSTVIATLNRHNWTNMIITADLTGSMSPYTAQLFVWLSLNTTNDRVKQFVFFNDGDMTPDHKKIIGKTGGIYETRSSKFEEVEKLAFTTMRNGGGGDSPENDIESLIKAIELCPTCTNIVLIADNWAPIKDISLMTQIKKPIKIILCGADYGINTQYLDLARMTGGSIHIMEDDLTELIKINEGEEITIRGQSFKIEKGKFVRI